MSVFSQNFSCLSDKWDVTILSPWLGVWSLFCTQTPTPTPPRSMQDCTIMTAKIHCTTFERLWLKVGCSLLSVSFKTQSQQEKSEAVWQYFFIQSWLNWSDLRLSCVLLTAVQLYQARLWRLEIIEQKGKAAQQRTVCTVQVFGSRHAMIQSSWNTLPFVKGNHKSGKIFFFFCYVSELVLPHLFLPQVCPPSHLTQRRLLINVWLRE